MRIKKVAVHPLLFKPKRYTTVVMALLVLVGLAGSLFAGISIRTRTRESLMSRAVTAAAALDFKDIKTLRGNEKDLELPAYQELKAKVTRIRSNNPDIRFVYLLGRNSNQDIHFIVDSEPTESDDYSPPGEIYPEASDEVKGSFVVSKAFIEGPLGDSYGSWVSALVPLVDPLTNNTIALLGIDLPVADYYWQIFTYSAIPLLLAAIPLAGLLRDRKLESKEREINQLKTQFVSVASHELRSPLAGVLWAAQSMIKPGTNKNLQDAQRSLLVDIYGSTATSLATVNEILDFSVFDRDNAQKLEREPVDLVPVLKEAQKTLKLSSQESGIEIVFSGKWPESAQIIGDVASLKRAFTNIVSNALKYSLPKTKVELVYHFQNGQHVIAVRDHGIGIPRTEQKRVLEGYYRATNATKFQARGTGMGLWITRLIMEKQGGRLWIKSKEHEGTIVFVSLPSSSPTAER